MANNVVNRQVNIFIESGQAQKALDALIKKETALKLELEKATNPKQVQRINDELKKLEEPIDRARKKLSGELTASFKDVQATVNSLGNRLKRMSKEDADFEHVLQQYRQANAELEAQRNKVGLLQRAMKSFWQEAKTVAVGVIVGNTVQTMLQTVMGYVTGIVTGSAKLSDELADIQRITGLQKNEVKELNGELKKIDTRTGTSALRDITIVAGKLGIEGKENLLQFVTAVDKLNIAMGGELGDINQFTTDLGKILNVFEGQITGDNITAVGNAIVTLANKGVASGPFIVDFTQRVAAIAKTSNLSLDAVIGLAAGLEESGLKVESSATAIQKILSDIASDIPNAARVAGVEIKEFQQLFSEKPQEALLLYAKGLVANKESFAEVTAAFKDQGEDGARVISTLATIGQKTDFFREKMQLAGGAIKDTTAITAAFELKNQTAGAELDKFKKNFAGLFQSQSFQEAGQAAIAIMNAFVNGIKASFKFIGDHKVLIGSLAAIYVLATSAVEKSTIANLKDAIVRRAKLVLLSLEKTATALSVAGQLAYGAAVDFVKGRITLATAAQRIWSTVTALGAGPLGVLLVAIGGLAIGLQNLFSRTKALTAEQRLQLEVTKKAAEILGDQAANVERWAKMAANENLQLSERKKAIDELIKINPAFADTLKINTQGHLEGAQAVADYIKALNKKAEAEAKSALLTDKIREKQNFLQKVRTDRPGLNDASDETIVTILKNEMPKDEVQENIAMEAGNANEKRKIQAGKELKKILADIDILSKGIERDANEASANAKKTVDDTLKPIGDTIESLRKKLEELNKLKDTTPAGKRHNEILTEIETTQKKIDELEGKKDKAVEKAENDIEKLQKELLKLKENLSLNSMSFLDKELAEVDLKYSKLAERAKGNNKLLVLIQELHGQEILQVIRAASRREVAEWEKGQGDILKKQEESFKKNIERLKSLHDGLVNTTIINAERFGIDRLAKDELAVIISHGKKKLEAELKLLKDQETQELSAKDLTENQKLLIEEKFRRKRKQAELDHWIGLVNEIASFAQQVLDIGKMFADAQTEKENAELDRDRKLNDQKKANLDRRLKAGTLSQLQYNRDLDKIDRDRAAKEKALQQKQFERNKQISIVQSIINTAVAVTKALESAETPLNFILAGIVGAAGLAETSLIASKKPSFGEGGAFLQGPSHSDRSKGMPVMNPYTGAIQAFLEGGEMIGSKRTANDQRRYGIEGTPSQIFSFLNGMNGGVQWTSGAVLRPAWSTKRPSQMNFGAINSSIGSVRRFYAGGGKFNDQSAGTGQQPGAGGVPVEFLALMKEMIATNAATQQTLADIQKNGVNAYMLLSQFEKQRVRDENLKNDAKAGI